MIGDEDDEDLDTEVEEEDTEDEVDEDDEQEFCNYYLCPRCNKTWQDTWSCACDDDCPYCGKRHISPYHSEDLGDDDDGPDMPKDGFDGDAEIEFEVEVRVIETRTVKVKIKAKDADSAEENGKKISLAQVEHAIKDVRPEQRVSIGCVQFSRGAKALAKEAKKKSC